MIGVGASRDLVYRAAENEGIEQLIGDELAGPVIILGPPGGGDLGAELRVEAGALQRDVAQDGDHVDHEGLAFGSVEGLAPAVVEQAQQIAAEFDIAGRAPRDGGALEDVSSHLRVGRQRFRGPAEVAVGFLRAQVEKCRPIGRDVDGNPMRRLEHRLQRGHFVIELQGLTAPQGPYLIDRLGDARDGVVVGNRHLGEPER